MSARTEAVVELMRGSNRILGREDADKLLQAIIYAVIEELEMSGKLPDPEAEE